MAAVYYHTRLSASGGTAAAREIQVGRFPATVNTSPNLNLTAQAAGDTEVECRRPQFHDLYHRRYSGRRVRPRRLANLGIGHAALDGGGGYTYFNPQTGQEFSAVAGFTYNFKNPDTQYQSGIDFHIDWGMSQFLSKQVHVGFVGYAYQQIADDFGQHPMLGGFRSRVLGVGPQVGFLFRLETCKGT